MKKNIFLIITTLFLMSACQFNPVVKTHGISYLENREKLIFVNKSNKNDVVNVLGQPATKGMTNDNLWIYIERTRTRGAMLKLGRNYLKKNNVLVLEFTSYGILSKKEFFDKSKMERIAFVKGQTENDVRKENFVYSFLSSIRQKMQTKKK